MKKAEFVLLLEKFMPAAPSVEQQAFFYRFADFMANPQSRVFILQGYAGTGKTSCLRAVSRALNQVKYKNLLMAPTGRAAKVVEQYSGQQAYTIHRIIYSSNTLSTGEVVFKLARNSFDHALLIVDEASMIGSAVDYSSSFNSGASLLDDLIEYLHDAEHCKILICGDPAQLPPVGEKQSNALDLKYLKSKYNLNPEGVFFKQVHRQSLESQILANATSIRSKIETELVLPLFDHTGSEVQCISGYELEEVISSAYANYSLEDCVILTYSNKRANQFNQEIKKRILLQDAEIVSGDLMMVVRNNFYWGNHQPGLNFIANGEIATITAILDDYERYGFRFMKALLHFPFLPHPEVEAILNLDSLYSEQASMSADRSKMLYDAINEEYSHIASKGLRRLKVKMDPHLNALQVKFAYAITGHKSQGGQWPVVFIDQGFMTVEKLDQSYLRWLYTVTTRASAQLYLVNFNPVFIA